MKLFTKSFLSLLLLCLAGVVIAAADGEGSQNQADPGSLQKLVKKTAVVDEITTVEELVANKFMLQHADDGLMLCALQAVGNYWDVNAPSLLTAISDPQNAAFYQLVEAEGHYQMAMYNINGERRTFWAGDAYVNAQPDGNVIFGLGGTAPNYGQDGPNLALWDVTYTEGQGFAFHNVGRNTYIGEDGSNARPSDQVFYWKAYKGYSAVYDEAETTGAYSTVAPLVKTSETAAALAAAKAAYDEDKDINKLGDAVNAAIDDVKACAALNEAYSHLDVAGAAVAAEVKAKYEAGGYANVAELIAAYAAAVRAQTTAGADMTLAIVNPSFETGNINGWTSTDGGGTANNGNFHAVTGTFFVERWTNFANGGKLSDGSFLQTISGLPNGKYTVTAQMQNREQGNGDAAGKGFFLVANDDKTEGVTNDGQTISVSTTVTDGTLVIGTKLEGCTGNWVCVDNFKLTLDELSNTPEPQPEPQPTNLTLAATLVHTASSFCGDDPETYTSTVDAEAEHVNNATFNTKWQGAAYAEFALSGLTADATIQSATLTFTGIGESRNNRNCDVYAVNAGEVLDYEALAAGAAKVNLPGTSVTTVSFPKGSSATFTVDVLDQLKAIVAGGQKYIIFKMTGNPGGGDVVGKGAAEGAPKLVIEYIPGAPEIANATFDANPAEVITVTTQGYQRNVPEGSDQISGLQPVTGWTPGTQTASDPGFCGGIFAYGSENLLNNKVAAPATAPEGSNSPSALGLSAVWAGIAQYTQDVTIAPGDYKLTYTVYNGANTGAVEKNLFGFIAEDGTEYLSDATTFAVGEWSTIDVAFTLTKETTGKISVGFKGAGGSGAAPHLFLDQVQLTKVPGLEIALIDLKKAIEAAQAKAATYTVGEGLFLYPASELEPLTQAIATAQAAYEAAESKEAVAGATEALTAFVAAFAPAATAPDADKAYTLQLRLEGETPLYMALAEGGITIAEEATPLKFVAAETAGQFYLANEDGTLFVGLDGGNAWTMSTLAEKKAAWTFTNLTDGAFRINNLVTAGRFVGTNAAEKAAGSPCYADKLTSNGNVDWIITEAVAPFNGRMWDFTQWSDATIANLKADAAASKTSGWSDVEKKADAEADAEPTEATKDNCFWYAATTNEDGSLSANGVVIDELKGLVFSNSYTPNRSLAIAVNYPSTSLGDYAGGAYLWLGGGKNKIPCFTIPEVEAGSVITMEVESHKPAEGRGVELYYGLDADGKVDAATKIGDTFAPTTKESHTWTVENAGDVIVYNTNGCHIYNITVEKAAAEMPMLTLKATVGQEVSIKPGVYGEFDIVSVDFGDGVLVTDSVGHENKGICVNDGSETWPEKEGTTHTGITEFKGTAAGDGIIKVYGNDNLWYLAVAGAVPTSFDQEKMKKLVQLNISKVAVDAIDLKGLDDLKQFSFSQGSLKSINVKDNAALTSLTVNNNSSSAFESVLESLDVSGNANLEQLNLMASAEKPGKLTVLDLSKNTKLTNLYAQYNALTSVILPEGAALSFVNLQNNQLESIDLTKVASFKDTYLNNNKLSTVDLSKLTAGANLYLDGNQLTEVDVPVTVKNLQLNNNKLTKVAVAGATASCKLEGNQLTLATIPAQPAGMNTQSKTKKFTYAPQADLEVAETLMELDLSAQLTVEKGELNPDGYATWLTGSTTFSFVTASGAVLAEGTDYEVTEPGKFRFLKEQAEKVHAVMLNAALPKFTADAPFKTTEFEVKAGDVADDPELVAPEGWHSVVSNGNLAGDVNVNFYTKENGGEPVIATIMAGAGKNGSRGIVVNTPDNPAQDWDAQFFITADKAIPAGAKIHVEFDYMATQEAGFDTQCHALPGDYIHWYCIDSGTATTEWQHYSKEVEVSAGKLNDDGSIAGDWGKACDAAAFGKPFQTVAFNLSKVKTATTFHFDNITFWVTDIDTGVKSVWNVNAEDGAVYDLQGRRVAKPGKGLYIINGKKVTLK